MNRPRLLLTRPRQDSRALAKRLEGHDIDALIEPMMTIRIDRAARLDLAGVQAILLTSANGARALAALPADPAARRLPVLAVGVATAAEARRAGFGDVTSADGDVADLAALATARLRPDAGRLVHVTGRVSAGDLARGLCAAGFEAVRAPLYDAVAARALSPAACRALEAQTLAGVVLSSPRTADLFVKLAREAGHAPKLRAIIAFCLSDAVATSATALSWRAVSVADAPRQEALVACVTRWAKGRPRPAEAAPAGRGQRGRT